MKNKGWPIFYGNNEHIHGDFYPPEALSEIQIKRLLECFVAVITSILERFKNETPSLTTTLTSIFVVDVHDENNDYFVVGLAVSQGGWAPDESCYIFPSDTPNMADTFKMLFSTFDVRSANYFTHPVYNASGYVINIYGYGRYFLQRLLHYYWDSITPLFYKGNLLWSPSIVSKWGYDRLQILKLRKGYEEFAKKHLGMMGIS